jgi:inorganic triphosphatase YgiF
LELKLELTREELLRVRARSSLPRLTMGEPVTRKLRAIYFDTPDHRLHAQGLSLHLRFDGGGWLQRVERVTPEGLAASRNGEGEETTLTRPEPDLAAIPSPRMRRKVEKVVARSMLEPIFETNFERTTRRLHAADGELNLVLDEGCVRAGSAEGLLCEAELELKSGPPATLLATAAELFAAEEVRFPPSSRSERGYSLALRKSNAVSFRRAEPPKLKRGQTCAKALMQMVEAAAGQIHTNRQGVLASEDPAAAHQLRIGLRRLRSTLRPFRPADPTPALRELEGHARTLARTVGQLRDADVLIEQIFAPVAVTIKDDPGLQRVHETLVAHRTQARERVRAHLGGAQWSRLQLYLALFPRTVADAAGLEGPVEKLARSALKRQWKKVADCGERFDDLTLEERHEMRKALKGLRYSCEYFTSLYPGEKTRRFIKEVRNLQEAFGYLNDVAAAGRLGALCHDGCGADREAQRAAGYILGWHNAQALLGWKQARKGWHKLRRLPRFWA